MTHKSLLSSRRMAAAALLGCAAAALPAQSIAQAPPYSTRSASTGSGPRVASQALSRGRYVVVVDLDANRLYFAHGRRVLWSAPVGTGTGLRLESDRSAWDFDTPNGVFHVQFKEKDPTWRAPDWWFVENGLPVPPPNDPRRLFPGDLGSAAVYIGNGLAIHGTDKPELLGQRVSHGCIRLSNQDAWRLFHDVQLGTEVVIVGGQGQTADPAEVARRKRNQTGRSAPPPRDPLIVALERQPTDELLGRMSDEMFVSVTTTGTAVRWPAITGVLVERGIVDRDDDALDGVMARVSGLGTGVLRDEYSAFLADAYARGTLRSLESLSRLRPRDRMAAARAIVAATVGLFPGLLDDPATPWPTKRAPRDAVGDEGADGWDALHAAEQEYRDTHNLSRV
jgi:lipoprotein-anchoring transpeptidase ErfK/SrfK